VYRTTTRLLVAACAALLLLPAPPAVAAPAACGPGPVELVGGGDTTLVAGREHVQGYLLRRRLGGGETCVLPGATVHLLARTTGSSTATVVRTGTTDDDGRVQFRVRPPYTVVLTGRSAAQEGFPAVDSAPAVLRVATRLTVNRRAVTGCRVQVTGSTYPAKPGNGVNVESTDEQGRGTWLGSTSVAADGTFARTVNLPCGSTSRIYTTIPQTARNDYGSSDFALRIAATTRTCGAAKTGTGEAAALTHVFEPFNTTVAVGGSWWGERVVANRTDRTIVLDTYSTDLHQLLRRGSTVRIGSNGTSDAIVVERRELAPGAELRERIALVAGNCDAEVPAGYVALASSPGPAFPAGTALVGQAVLATSKGVSVSQRVALTVS